MFTIKLYSEGDYRQVIRSAESLTILRDEAGESEITLHQRNQSEDSRVDIKYSAPEPGWPAVYSKAIIENMAGRTTQIIALGPNPAKAAISPKG